MKILDIILEAQTIVKSDKENGIYSTADGFVLTISIDPIRFLSVVEKKYEPEEDVPDGVRLGSINVTKDDEYVASCGVWFAAKANNRHIYCESLDVLPLHRKKGLANLMHDVVELHTGVTLGPATCYTKMGSLFWAARTNTDYVRQRDDYYYFDQSDDRTKF